MADFGEECPCLGSCPLAEALKIIGGKWKFQIICALHSCGTTRYNHLKRKIKGISDTVLASSLQELESDGLVIREQYMEVPPRVEYRVTEAGKALIPIADQLGDWVGSFRK
ncbi:transcriptional regulator [Deltaproteobacteria bacterium Smac51]|nr:transcriptional regulator [Deltaproteobacteria bacterium Smac51]